MKKVLLAAFALSLGLIALPGIASAATRTISDFESGLNGWNNGSIVPGYNSNGALRLHNDAFGATGSTKYLNSKILTGFATLEMDVNLNGNYILGNDASAIVFDQGGWKYVSMKDYVQNGKNGWQHISIPLSNFTGLDSNHGIASMTIRFWNEKSCDYDIDNIVLSGGSIDPIDQPTGNVIADFSNGNSGFDRGVSSNGVLTISNPAYGDASTKKIINSPLLKGYSTLEFDINLNGKSLLDGDAGAVIFDQSGPKYIPLKNRVNNGLSGWQHIKISLSDFAGLNVNDGIAALSFRFWNYTPGTYNLDNIALTNNGGTTPGNIEAPTNLSGNVNSSAINLSWNGGAPEYIIYRNNAEIARTTQKYFSDSNLGTGNYNYFVKAKSGSEISSASNSVTLVILAPDPNPSTGWQIKSIDSQVMSKYWAISDENQIRSLVRANKALGAKQMAISINYDNYNLLRIWANIIHSEGLNVWFRSHWNDWDSWEKPEIKNGIKSSEYLQRTKQFILDHPELFRAGDAFTMCVESENAAWWTGIDPSDGRGPFNGWEDWRAFTRNQVLMANDAFAQIGLGGKVKTNWINMNGWVAWEAMDQYTANTIGQITLDHIIDWTDDTNTYVTSLFSGNSNGFKGYDDYYNKWHVPMMAGEWGYSTFNQNIDPNHQKELAAAVFSEFAKRSYIAGINYWIDVGHASRLFDTPNLIDYQRRPIADVVAQYFA